MQNKIITNKQGSIVALAPLLDAAGNALVLQPKGTKGDEREITTETAEDEIIERVKKAGWVSVRALAATPPVAVPPPVVDRAPPPAPEPVVETPPAIEPVTESLPSESASEPEALAEQTKQSEPSPKVKRDRR